VGFLSRLFRRTEGGPAPYRDDSSQYVQPPTTGEPAHHAHQDPGQQNDPGQPDDSGQAQDESGDAGEGGGGDSGGGDGGGGNGGGGGD
jgi:hypothetical protein